MHINHQYYLITDFEATCSDNGIVPREEMEIIEIGAVLVSSRSFEIESEFQTFVRPVRHPQLTFFCTSLTGITQSQVDTAPLFPEGLGAWRAWAQGFDDALFCSWGNYDRKQLLQDCQFHKVEYPFVSGHLNLKEEFSRSVASAKRFGVTEALRHLGMDFKGRHHRGLDDAQNIARIVRHVCTTSSGS